MKGEDEPGIITGSLEKVIVNYKYISTKTKFNVIYCNHMFHSHPILKDLSNPFYLPLLSYRTLQPQMNVCCVRVYIWRDFHICDRKYRFESNFCVIRLLPTYTYFFMYALNASPYHSNVKRWNFLY